MVEPRTAEGRTLYNEQGVTERVGLSLRQEKQEMRARDWAGYWLTHKQHEPLRIRPSPDKFQT